jgi:site-specific recombinase XerD
VILDEYTVAMRRRYLADGTIRARGYEVRRWVAVCPGWVTADREDIERYLDGRALGARARYTAISHLHRFYVWAIREGHAEVDPTAGIERPRLPHRLPRPARLGDVELVIAGARPRLATVMLLMVDAGLRCCEAARLEWDDVDLAAGVVVVRGKGDRDRMLGLTPRLAANLATYNDDAGPVFGRTVTPGRLSQIVNHELHAGGLNITAHRLRHTFATRAYRLLHGDLLALAQLLGHASVLNTQIYARVDVDAAAAAVRRL